MDINFNKKTTSIKKTDSPETWPFKKAQNRDFPGGSVVKNLPANAGDTGLIPGPENSMCLMCHNCWSPCALGPSGHN